MNQVPYPNRSQIYAIFANLHDPSAGTARWFEYVDPAVHWTVTGHSRFSGSWTSRAAYHADTWGKIDTLLAPPGYVLEVPGGENGVIAGQDGWAVVEMKTVGVKTRGGVPYLQHYSWHVRFSEEGKVVEGKAFLDLGHLEEVLGGEIRRQEGGEGKRVGGS